MHADMTQPVGDFDPRLWREANEVFDAALDLEGEARVSFLAQIAACAPDVHRAVCRLLARVEGSPAPADSALTRTAPAPFRRLLVDALDEAPTSRVPEPKAGDRCGPWRLIELIGSGGMGEVWLAERADGLYTARVAVKFLKTDSDLTRFITRFAQERELLARLDHPGIARMLDAGFKDGAPYLVLEYVAGQRLLDYVRAHAPHVRERIELIRQVGEALVHAHSKLVVHRDIKPSNIIVTANGQVKLLDFGVAGLLDAANPYSITESPATRIAGRGLTVEYAAPEQILGKATGVASDIYSTAALAYHLCAGRRAHMAEHGNRAALEHEVLHIDPLRVSLAARLAPPCEAPDLLPPPVDPEALVGDVDAILAQGMRRNPSARYPTMSELVGDIDRWLRHLPINARKEDRRYRTRLWLRRNWLAATLSSALIAALVIGFGVAVWQADRARAEAYRASKAASFLIEMLNGADPDVHGGQWPTVLTLIEQARSEVPARFKDDPGVELQISFHLATTLRRLSRFRDALPLARRAVELATRELGADADLTRQSQVLLADILYWVDETREGLPMLERVLAGPPPARAERWWREAVLLRANMLGELRRFAESHAEFDRYMKLIEGLPDRAWLTAEAEIDRALIHGREGRLRDAYHLHLKYKPLLEQPPQRARRVALNALMNLAHFQIRLAQTEGVESTLQGVIGAWDKLAGRTNRHSLEALDELGLYYLRFGEAEAALAVYAERRARALSMTPPDTATALVSLFDDLEVRIKRGKVPPLTLLDAIRDVEGKLANEPRIPPLQAANLSARLVTMYLATGDLRAAHGTWLSLPATGDLYADPRTAARHVVTEAALKAAADDPGGACAAMSALLERAPPADPEYDTVLRHLRRALYCTLAGATDAAVHRREAVSLIPRSLPPDHRLRAIARYIEALAEHPQKAPAAMLKRLAAETLDVSEANIIHPSIPGLWL